MSHPSTWHLRRIRPDEGLALHLLKLRAYSDAPQAFGPILRQLRQVRKADLPAIAAHLAASPTEATYFAEDRDQHVGLGSILLEGETAFLSFVWVRPGWRHLGVAPALVKRLEQWAYDAGHRELYGRVLDCNLRAIAFYERLGWVCRGDEPWPSNPSRSRTVIHKTLEPGYAPSY